MAWCHYAPLQIAGTSGNATAGAILFAGASGAISQDLTGLFYDQAGTKIVTGGNHLEMNERADPAAPAANKAAFYCRDSGGGKTQLVARFPTGAVQVIATEP